MDDLNIIIIIGTLLFLGLLFFIIAFLFLYQKRRSADMKEKLELKNQFTHTLLQSQLEIQEQIFENISEELHDNLGQVASLIKINLTTLPTIDPGAASQKLNDTKELVKQLISDIKSLSVSIGASTLKKTGIVKAVEIEVERINKTEQFKVNFKVDGIIPALTESRSTIVFRMVQEILNNVVKHSNASNIEIKLIANENSFTLAVSDDGNGFNLEEAKRVNSGAGLQNLYKRASLINGSIDIQSDLINGTLVIIEAPYGDATETTHKTSFS